MLKLPLRKLYFIVKLCFLFVLVLITLSLFEYWRGGKRATRAVILDPEEDKYEKEILEDEARIVPGLGEGGQPAYLTGEEKRLGEEAEKKYAINTYLSDRIAYNRTLKDFRNPACERVIYDAELPSASVIIIFHNEPYSVVIRTIWSVLNTARRDRPWHRRANFLESGTGRIMKLGYPGQPPDSEYVYLREIILVDDNSTLPELRGKLARYVRTRTPPGLVRVLRLPDRLGLTRARYAGAGAAGGDVLVFLDAHCEGDTDWLRPLLHRVKHSPKIGLTRARLAGARYATGDVLIFLDAHCEGVVDWLRPLLQRIKDEPTAVVLPIIDVIEHKDFFYSVQEPSVFQGLMRARVTGARAARGDVLVFLDAHCEAESDWLRPLLQRLAHKRDAVVTPVIDVVDQNSFHLDGEDPIQVGGFTFVGHFTWIDVPEREKRRRGSDIAPTWSPTMAGGLFAIRRAYYWELGAYDEQMAGWGGENLEMSFRIWQCGGTLETIPCSRVGHVFRSFHPYGLPASSDTHGINTARMAEVWMDEYAELFYLHRPDLRKNPVIGDVTHRKVLREKLHCKSFQWFLDNVYQEKFVPVRDSRAYGRVQNPATRLCLDTMQRDGEATPLGYYPCHDRLAPTQYLSLSLAGQLRDEEKCAEVQFIRRRGSEQEMDGVSRLVVMVTCREHVARMQWRYVAHTQQLQHVESGLCLEAGGARAGGDARAGDCGGDVTPSQRWLFDYGPVDAGQNDTSKTGLLPEELEQRLRLLRRQRRKSRSLLSVDTDAEQAADSPHEGEVLPREGELPPHEGELLPWEGEVLDDEARRRDRADKRRRKPRSKRKKKIVHKNKFIVTIERQLANHSAEHLEMDIHCQHQRLYPNNSFVRDLVTILNDKDIRVINNGRVFEKNKVTDLGKLDPYSMLRKEKRVLEKLPVQGAGEVTSEPKTEKPPTPPSTPTTAPGTPSGTFLAQHFAEVAPLLTTETVKHQRKHHHKKKTQHRDKERSAESPEDSPMLMRKQHRERPRGYHVSIGGGNVNGSGVRLRDSDEPGEPPSVRGLQNYRQRWPGAGDEVRRSSDARAPIGHNQRDLHDQRDLHGQRDLHNQHDLHSQNDLHDQHDLQDQHEQSDARYLSEQHDFHEVRREGVRPQDTRDGKTRAEVLKEVQGLPVTKDDYKHRDGIKEVPWSPPVARPAAGPGRPPGAPGQPRRGLYSAERWSLPARTDPRDRWIQRDHTALWDTAAQLRSSKPRLDSFLRDLWATTRRPDPGKVYIDYDQPMEEVNKPDNPGPIDYDQPLAKGVYRARDRDTDSDGNALRVLLKSNVTFNLGDELVSWRRNQRDEELVIPSDSDASDSASDDSEPSA